ncbi:MAG: hypothetical protein HDQ89_07950 [Desulfovibrio sp.]|nr:hypothetical protein [Desulfovibrio sp.]
MITLDLGMESFSMTIPPILTYILLLGIIILACIQLNKSQIYNAYKFVALNFFTIWYFLLISFFAILTTIFYTDIDFSKFNFITLISCVLVGLLILPFFKKVVAFGVEAELAFAQNAEKFFIIKQINPEVGKQLTKNEQDDRDRYTESLKEAMKIVEGK